MDSVDALGTALIGIAIIVGLFFLFRNIVLWYFKIDQIVKNQEKQISQMGRQLDCLEEICENLKSSSKKETNTESKPKNQSFWEE